MLNTETVDATAEEMERASDAAALIEIFLEPLRPLSAIGMVAADYSVNERSDLLPYSSMVEVFTPLDTASPWWSDDPVVARLGQGEMLPFAVKDAWANPLPSAAPRWQTLVDLGFHCGHCFPTARPGHVGGVIVFVDPGDADRLGEHLALVHTMATYLHSFMTEMDPDPDGEAVIRNTLRHRPKEKRRHKLSPREVACLRWCAFGKTAEETAAIEGISVHTVRDYLKSAMRKLDARSQAQAVARAMRYGLFRI